MTVQSDAHSTQSVDNAVQQFLDERAGTRGVDAYAWLVSVLRASPGSSSIVYLCGAAKAVVTSSFDQFVIHSLTGEDDAERATIIDHVRGLHPDDPVRGLALPGDRRTKNLFEEAHLPAQALLH